MPLRRAGPRRVSGERLLADAAATQAHLGGTRDALYVVRHRGDQGPSRSEDRPSRGAVEAADWDARTDPAGQRGRQLGPGRPVHVFRSPNGRLLSWSRGA